MSLDFENLSKLVIFWKKLIHIGGSGFPAAKNGSGRHKNPQDYHNLTLRGLATEWAGLGLPPVTVVYARHTVEGLTSLRRTSLKPTAVHTLILLKQRLQR